jgi:hypothetical protein
MHVTKVERIIMSNVQSIRKDFSMHHQALKVEKGIKFTAKSWIHLRDLEGPHEVGCS